METNKLEQFLHLMRYSIGADSTPPDIDRDSGWGDMYDFLWDHDAAALCFEAIARMPDSKRPTLNTTICMAILSRSREDAVRPLYSRCMQVARKLATQGFYVCLINSLPMALLYPGPLQRHCTVVDLWVCGDNRKVMDFVSKNFTATQVGVCDPDFPMPPECCVRLFSYPTMMLSSSVNLRLIDWFGKHAVDQFSNAVDLPGGVGAIATPTFRFNMVYMLLRTYRCFFAGKLAFLNLVDYHLLMVAFFRDAGPGEADAVRADISHLGLTRFARSLMYVLGETQHTPASSMIVPPSRKHSGLIFSEVFCREGMSRPQAGWLLTAWRALRRRFLFMLHYPSETFGALWFRFGELLFGKTTDCL